MSREGADSFVYFMRRADGEGPIKIGHARTPSARLKHIAHGAPYPLQILAEIPGGAFLERRFHAAFVEQHSHCEWFHSSPRLEAVVAAVAAGVFDVAELPEPERITHPTGPWSADRKWGLRLRTRLREFRAHHPGVVPEVVWRTARDLTVQDDVRRAEAVGVVGRFLNIHGALRRIDREAA